MFMDGSLFFTTSDVRPNPSETLWFFSSWTVAPISIAVYLELMGEGVALGSNQ